MQAQKFDATKPHGTVYGHTEAVYEQDGVLFDGGGVALGGVTEPKKGPGPKKIAETKKEGTEQSPEELFLLDLLSGGPILQTNVKRESEKKGLIWSDVLTSAAKMQINKFKSGIANLWKLPEDQ